MAMEINSAYNNVYESAYTAQKQETKKQAVSSNKGADTTKQANEAANIYGTRISANQTTDEYLSRLNEKYSSLNIMAGSVDENYRGGSYPNKVDVMIAPSILKKMASDPKEAQKYERMLSNIPACEKWANSMIKAMTGNEVTYRQVWIDENGNMGSFSISEPSEKQKKVDEKQKEDAHEQFEERLKKAKENQKKIEERLQGKRANLPEISVMELKKSEKSEEKKVVKEDGTTTPNKAEQLLEEKIAASKDGMIYLNDTDMKTIIEAVQEEDAGKTTVKDQPQVGANLDLKI